MRIFTIKCLKKYGFQLLGLFIILISWEIFAYLVAKPILVPQLKDIFLSIINIFSSEKSFKYIFYTLFRVFITMIFSLSFGLILGVFSGLNTKIEKTFFVAENILRTLPTAVVILLALIWFRSNLTPIFVGSLILLPLFYRDTADAVKNIPIIFTEMSDDFKVSFFIRLKYLYLPYCIFTLRTSLVTAMGLAVKVVVMSELLSQPKNGIGVAFQIAKTQLDTATIFAWGIITVLIAVILQVFIKICQKGSKCKYAK